MPPSVVVLSNMLRKHLVPGIILLVDTDERRVLNNTSPVHTKTCHASSLEALHAKAAGSQPKLTKFGNRRFCAP